MNVSPLDLRQQRFRTAIRGFDKVEVTSFLLAVADDYEQALREADRLRQELNGLEGVVNEGNLAAAATEFETYVKLAPEGTNAATAKSLLAQLKK